MYRIHMTFHVAVATAITTLLLKAAVLRLTHYRQSGRLDARSLAGYK